MGNYLHKKCTDQQRQAIYLLATEKEHLQQLLSNSEQNFGKCTKSLETVRKDFNKLQKVHKNIYLNLQNKKIKITNLENKYEFLSQRHQTLDTNYSRVQKEYNHLISTIHTQERHVKILMRKLATCTNVQELVSPQQLSAEPARHSENF
jgi:chromosome segregation ATPase